MAITLKDGGPAFPCATGDFVLNEGMSMRQWYAAHAPAVPEWFRLKNDSDWPKVPAVPKEWDAAELAEFTMLKAGTLELGAVSDDVLVFWRRYEPARARLEAWRDKMRQKKFFAWRWYYADQMIASERGEQQSEQ